MERLSTLLAVYQTVEQPVIGDAMKVTWCYCNGHNNNKTDETGNNNYRQVSNIRRTLVGN